MRERSRFWAMAAVLAAGSLSFVGLLTTSVPPAAAGDEDNVPFDRTSEHAIDEAIRLRGDFGLQSDRDFVVTAAADVDLFPNIDWGVPLSTEESTELMRRMVLQESLAPAVEYAQQQPSFAGFYLDQKAGGVPVFEFVSSSDEIDSGISARLPPATEFRVEVRDRSYQELSVIANAIGSDFNALWSRGIRVTSYAIDQVNNVVLVGVDGPNDVVEATLRDEYGDQLVVRSLGPGQADTCTSRLNCWPMKGGIHIQSTFSPNNYCTSGFIARHGSPSTLVVVTAGHCIWANGGLSKTWQHHGNTFGTSSGYVWESFTTADVGFITISSSAKTAMNGAYRRYLSNDSPISIVNLEDVASNSFQQPGYSVCRMGRTSGRDCGTILYVGGARYSCVGTDCRLINVQNEVSFDSSGGDSGGSVFSGVGPLAFGLHVHSDPDGQANAHGWYSTLGNARQTLIDERGVTIDWCIKAGCVP